MRIETTVSAADLTPSVSAIRRAGGFVIDEQLYIIDDEDTVLRRGGGASGDLLYCVGFKLEAFIRGRDNIRVAGPGDSFTITF